MMHRIAEQVPLAPLTTFRVGGPARFFTEATSLEEVYEALAFAREKKVPVFVLGGGSNIVVSDEGFEGLVLAIRIPDMHTEDAGEVVHLTAGAGVVWDELVVYAIEHGLAGLECLSGVPGTVGGAVVANVGAYRAEVSDTLESALVLDMSEDTPAPRVYTKEECAFSYHDSLFSQFPDRYVVLTATFALPKRTSAHVMYRDHRFDMTSFKETNGREATLSDVRELVLHVREQKGALIMPGRESYQCAGSFFHMPYVSPEKYADITARARALDATKEEKLRPWAWEQPDGSYKVAPGFLLEYTEFARGYTRGVVGISPKHILSIINHGGATATDIARLGADMQHAVADMFDIHLEREVRYVGFISTRA